MFSELTGAWSAIKETPEIKELLDVAEIDEEMNNLKTVFNEEGIVY